MVFLKEIALAYRRNEIREDFFFLVNLEKQVECRYTEIVFVYVGGGEVWLE